MSNWFSNNFGFPIRPSFLPNGAPAVNNQPAQNHQPAFAGGLARDEFVPSFDHAGPPPGLTQHLVNEISSKPISSFEKGFHRTTWAGLTNPPLENFPIVEGY